MLLVAAANASPDLDLDALADEFPEFHRGLLKYGRHFRHVRHPHHGPHHSLLKHAHKVHHRHHLNLDLDLDADDKPAVVDDKPMTLPGRHKSVEKALDGMSDDLQKLKDTKLAAKDARGKLEGSVTDTFQHMNDKVAIKRAMNKKQQELARENSKLEALEKDAGRLGDTREELTKSLHRMLEPKVMLARERFAKKEAILHKEHDAARLWADRREEMKASAMDLIKQKKAAHESLLESEAEVAQAKRKEELARIKYEHDAKETAEKVQSYRYAETRLKAEVQHEKAADLQVAAARESLEKLGHVEEVEMQKVEQSILFRKDRLRARIQQVQAAQQKSKNEMKGLEQKYMEWEEKQRERTAEVMRKSQETADASDAYQAKQAQVLDAARAKVVREAEAAGDWEGWGNDMTKVRDEDDDDDV